MRVVILMFLLLFCLIAPSRANDEAEFEALITEQYHSLEKELRGMIDNQVRLMDQTMKQRVEQRIISQPTDAQRREAIDLFKMIAYNKALNHVRCAYDLRKNLSKNPDKIDEQFRSCNSKRQAELEKFNKLSEYAPAMDSKKMLACEMKARDFESERRFPPFEFLKARGGPPAFDFRIYNECILSDS